MTKRLLTLGLVAAGLTGFVMASQWGHAAETPAYPVRATPEMMQLVRDEHDLVADMIKAQYAAGTRPVRRAKNGHHCNTHPRRARLPRRRHLPRMAETAERSSR